MVLAPLMANGWDDLTEDERVALVLRVKWANEERRAVHNPPPPREYPREWSVCPHVWSEWAWHEDQFWYPHENLPLQRDCPLCGSVDERAATEAEFELRRRIAASPQVHPARPRVEVGPWTAVYEYEAEIVAVHDGDTVTADIDLGCHVHIVRPVRLYGIDAPELATDAGKVARQALADMLHNETVVVRTVLDRGDKYGRLLGTLFVGPPIPANPDLTGVNVNAEMVATGHAVPYTGGKR